MSKIGAKKLPVTSFYGARELLPNAADLTRAHARPRKPLLGSGRVVLRRAVDVDEVDADVAIADAQLLHGQQLARARRVSLESV